jgi:hypothetical protein
LLVLLAGAVVGCGGRGLAPADAGRDVPPPVDARDAAVPEAVDGAPEPDVISTPDTAPILDASDAATDATATDATDATDGGTIVRYLGTFYFQAPYNVSFVAIGADGAYYLAGDFAQPIDVSPGEARWTPQGPNDAFLLKLKPDGSYAWGVTWGGPSAITSVRRVAVAGSSIVVSGIYDDTVDFDPGPGFAERPAVDGGFSSFAVSFSTTGAFRWASTFVSTSNCNAAGLAMDAAGDVYLSGAFSGLTDFDPGPGIDEHLSPGGAQVGFLVKLGGADGRRLWLTTFTGASCHGGLDAVTVSPDGDVWVTGSAESCTFAGSTGAAFVGNTLVASFAPSGAPRFAGWLKGDANVPRGIAAAPDGSIYVTGYGDGVVDFDPGPGEETREVMVQTTSVDLFVVKLSALGEFRWVHTIPTLSPLDLVTRPDNGVLVLGAPRDPRPDDASSLGTLLVKLESDGTPAWTVATGSTGVSPTGIAGGPTGFAVTGAAEKSASYAPAPAVDTLPSGIMFLSRFGDVQ